MEESPSQKVERVKSTLLERLSYEGIEILESSEEEVRWMGGFMTVMELGVIYYDPLAVDMAADEVLAFTLAHEHWHLGQERASEEDSADESRADDYALRKLKEAGWDLARARQCTIGFRMHEKTYFAALNQTRLDLVNVWANVTQDVCSRIWNGQSLRSSV